MTQTSRIEKLLQPATKEKAYQAALTFHQRVSSSSRSIDYYSLACEVVMGKFAKLTQLEIDVLVAVVFSETLRKTEEDIKEIEEELNKAKQAELELEADIRTMERLVELVSSDNVHVEGLSPDDIAMPEDPANDDSDLVGELSVKYDIAYGDWMGTIQSGKAVLDELKAILDSMNELSEATSLRLQMTMDRRSKFISTLSQMMKKISTTQDMVVQNIK